VTPLGAVGSTVWFCRQFVIACIFSTEPSTYTCSFFAACDKVEMKISTEKTEVLQYASQETLTSALCQEAAMLQQVKFQFLGVVFTSDGRRNKEIDAWIGEANAVLRELYRSVFKKRELSNTAKLSVFKSMVMNLGCND